MTSLTIGNGVTEIEESSFHSCENLESVYISDLSAWCKINFEDNPLRYYAKLYLNNDEVTELIIPDDIIEINKGAFECCESLTSVTIPNNVTMIGASAF